MNTIETKSKSRSLWPYAIIAWFAIFITAMVSWAVVATHNNMDLVRKDYYEEELRFQKQMDRVSRTAQLRNDISVTVDAGAQSLLFKLPADQANSQPTGQIHLYRPSDASLDQTIPLQVNESGMQRLDTSRLKGGLWKMRTTWKIGNDEFFYEKTLVIGSK